MKIFKGGREIGADMFGNFYGELGVLLSQGADVIEGRDNQGKGAFVQC